MLPRPPPGDTWVEKGLCDPIVTEDLAPLVPICAAAAASPHPCKAWLVKGMPVGKGQC